MKPTTYADITKAIGNTPLVRLPRIGAAAGAELFAKIESMNPLGSIKDRLAVAMIDDAEAAGRIISPAPPSSSRPAATPASAWPWSAPAGATT